MFVAWSIWSEPLVWPIQGPSKAGDLASFFGLGRPRIRNCGLSEKPWFESPWYHGASVSVIRFGFPSLVGAVTITRTQPRPPAGPALFCLWTVGAVLICWRTQKACFLQSCWWSRYIESDWTNQRRLHRRKIRAKCNIIVLKIGAICTHVTMSSPNHFFYTKE
jgi:hypothetical protein